jgi:phage-related protein
MPMDVVFYRTDSDAEPVRDWLKDLAKPDKRIIGGDIKTVQFGWPLGMPVVRKPGQGLLEIRSRLDKRIARVLLTVQDDTMILLHGFIKTSQKTAKVGLDLARQRKIKLGK